MKVKRVIKIDTNHFEVNDIIKFKLKNGQEIKARAVRETAEGMIFISTDCVVSNYPMFADPKNMGSVELNYINSDVRRYLNDGFLKQFPSKIRKRMVCMRIGCTDFFDMIRIPMEREIICGPSLFNLSEWEKLNVTQFKCMEKKKNRIAHHLENICDRDWYWTQSIDSLGRPVVIDDDGDANFAMGTNRCGVRIVFCLRNEQGDIFS